MRFDLRPESVKNVPPPKTRIMGLVMFCMFLAFGSAVSFAMYTMARDILYLQSEVGNLTTKVSDLNNVKTELNAELTRLANQEAVYVSSLSIMQQELPTIEVLDSLDRSLVRGVVLKTFNLTQRDLRLGGAAVNEGNIVESTRELLDSGAFTAAQVPVVTRTNTGAGGASVLNFTLSLTPLGIGEIGKNGP